MQFGEPPKPAPYLNSRDQRRMLGMVLWLSFVMFAVMWASRPENWHWLIPPDNETADNRPPEEAPRWDPLVSGNSADNGRSSPFDRAADSSAAANPFGVQTVPQPFAADNQPPAAAVPGESAPFNAAVIPREWLANVKDESLGIRAEEAEAYYRTLAHVRRIDEELLAKTARKDVVHANLIHDPSLFQGQLLTVRGTARRILPIAVNQNDFGIKQAYEVWFTSADSGNEPWRAVTTQIDSRLPQGEQVSAAVTVTGYFFKQYSYASQGGMHVAPLLLAGRVESYVVPQVAPNGTGLEPYIIGFAAVIGFCSMFAAFVYSQGDRRFRRKLARQFPPQDSASRELLTQLEREPAEPELFR